MKSGSRIRGVPAEEHRVRGGEASGVFVWDVVTVVAGYPVGPFE